MLPYYFTGCCGRNGNFYSSFINFPFPFVFTIMLLVSLFQNLTSLVSHFFFFYTSSSSSTSSKVWSNFHTLISSSFFLLRIGARFRSTCGGGLCSSRFASSSRTFRPGDNKMASCSCRRHFTSFFSFCF